MAMSESPVDGRTGLGYIVCWQIAIWLLSEQGSKS